MENVTKTHSSTGFYRADIDGMRALAVCLVIAAHLHLAHFTGGFVGVDVFFVISGYLISSILLRELGEGRFSVVAFYERRIRRIVPALFVVLVFTSVVAWCRMLPADLLDYSRSLIAATLSVSNVYFSRQSGYFDATADRRPLLHTWSLGVEEQFYLFFPLLLALLFRYARSWVQRIVIVLAFVSFATSAFMVYRLPTDAFYLAPTRAWELLLGTILAMGMVKLPGSRLLREASGVAGILLILAGTFGYHGGNHFPGAKALPPCLGAALIILAGQQRDSASYRLLSLKPIVFIGAISYSLYLWHWPLISLRSFNFHEQLHLRPAAVNGLILAESFLAGTLSWWFIERPFRKGSGVSRRTVFRGAALAACAALAFAFSVNASHGATARYKPKSVRLASYEEIGGDQAALRAGQCFIDVPFPGAFSHGFDQHACLPQQPDRPTYLIVGNSHAAHLVTGMSTVFADANWQQITGVGCLPDDDEKTEASSCKELRSFLFDSYLPEHHVDAILLSSDWELPYIGQLGSTLDRLAKFPVKVFVVGPIMRYDRPLPELLVEQVEHGQDPAKPLRAHYDPKVPEAAAILKTIVENHPGVRYISVLDLLCERGACITTTPDGTPLQSDDSHLTRAGSIYLARKVQSLGLFGRER